jgi:hypothetical protein
MNRSSLLAELKMDVLREREVKDSLERQLTEEQKLRGESRAVGTRSQSIFIDKL